MSNSFSAFFKTSKTSLEMVLGAVGELLDNAPGSVTFPRTMVDIVRTKDDSRTKVLNDIKETLQVAFTAHGASDNCACTRSLNKAHPNRAGKGSLSLTASNCIKLHIIYPQVIN